MLDFVVITLLILVGFYATVEIINCSFVVHAKQVPEPNEWAAWVQAIGSIAAIAGSFFLGERQSKKAIEAVRFGDSLALNRKRVVLWDLVSATVDIATEARKIFKEDSFGYLDFVIQNAEENLAELIREISLIPLHEVASAESSKHLVSLKMSLGYLQRQFVRAAAVAEQQQGNWSIKFDASALHLNCDHIIGNAKTLKSLLNHESSEAKDST